MWLREGRDRCQRLRRASRGELVGVHVIPRPADDLERIFPIGPK
jgi:microcompartment protein CcmL/EutN